MKTRSLFAIVPAKPFTACKGRLAAILSVKERERLGRTFLNHTLDVLKHADCVSNIVVVSQDYGALEMAAAAGARTVKETGEPEMNAAVGQGARYAIGAGADALLIVPTDLPLLTSDHVQTFGSVALSANANVVLAPDRHEAGTNLLYLSPPSSDLFRFGANSLGAYQALAARRQMSLHIHRSTAIALDVDTPADFQLWQRKIGHSQRESAVLD